MPGYRRTAFLHKRRRAAAATELVILLPFLCLLCLGTVDLGRFAYTHIVLSNAARVGAERGATKQFTSYTYDDWQEQIRESVREEMSSSPSFSADAMETVISTFTEPDNAVRVEVEIRYPFVPIVAWPEIGGDWNMSWRACMRQYR